MDNVDKTEKTKKYALVTGGGRGIGRAVALRLAKEGYDVAITYRNSKEGALELKKTLLDMGSNTEIFYADMSNLADLNAAFDAYEASYPWLDLLVNNAGVTMGAPFLETSPELFDQVINTDLRGVFFAAQRAAKYMIKQGREGCIVNISSNQAVANFRGNSVYGSAKAAVSKLTKHMALELARYNIRVNAVAPGLVDTGWLESPKNREADRHKKKYKTVIPLGSYAVPDQVAGIVAFLASDDAIYITGSQIVADGGAALPVIMDLPHEWLPESPPERRKSVLEKDREK
ncbi:MAG: SDR family oxidoreductase [Oscillospiraceae bacterium]|nr:SDR family oxidoreductase [Oscillospiraceae bacterium]